MTRASNEGVMARAAEAEATGIDPLNPPMPVEPVPEPVDDPVEGRIQALPDAVRGDAVRAYAVINRPDIAKGVAIYNRKLLDRILAENEPAKPASSAQVLGKLTPAEVRDANNAFRRPVDDPLGDLQQQVRTSTAYTDDQQVGGVRSNIEDAWLQQNVTDDAPPAPTSERTAAAPVQGAGIGEATAAVDDRVRQRRILDALQGLIDRPVENATQAIRYLDDAMQRIGDPALSRDEREHVLRLLDANAAFTGRTDSAPLPADAVHSEITGLGVAVVEP